MMMVGPPRKTPALATASENRLPGPEPEAWPMFPVRGNGTKSSKKGT